MSDRWTLSRYDSGHDVALTTARRFADQLRAATAWCWCNGSGEVGPADDSYACPYCGDVQSTIKRLDETVKAMEGKHKQATAGAAK